MHAHTAAATSSIRYTLLVRCFVRQTGENPRRGPDDERASRKCTGGRRCDGRVGAFPEGNSGRSAPSRPVSSRDSTTAQGRERNGRGLGHERDGARARSVARTRERVRETEKGTEERESRCCERVVLCVRVSDRFARRKRRSERQGRSRGKERGRRCNSEERRAGSPLSIQPSIHPSIHLSPPV